MTRDEIFEIVQKVLVDALGIDKDEIIPGASLIGDLDAESIDFLDIVFRLEKAFEIKIAREELFPIENMMSNPDFVSEGKLTDVGLKEMEEKMPHTDLESFKTNPDINNLDDLFTVDSLVNYIETKLLERVEIFEKVREGLTDILGINKDEITPDTILLNKHRKTPLGIEAIRYCVEIQFDELKINTEKLFPISSVKEIIMNPEFMNSDNSLMPEGIHAIGLKIPHADFRNFENHQPINADNCSNIFTVRSLVNYIERIIPEKSN